MSVTYDAELCARLAREARSPLLRMTASELRCFVSDKLPAMADQLDAARAEVEAKQRGYDDLHAMVPGDGDIWSKIDGLLRRMAADRGQSMSIESRAILERDRANAERDELRRTVDALQGQIEAVAPVVDAAEGYVHGPNLIGSVIDAIDAYRAAMGKTP